MRDTPRADVADARMPPPQMSERLMMHYALPAHARDVMRAQ